MRFIKYKKIFFVILSVSLLFLASSSFSYAQGNRTDVTNADQVRPAAPDVLRRPLEAVVDTVAAGVRKVTTIAGGYVAGGGGVPGVYAAFGSGILSIVTDFFNLAIYYGVYSIPDILKSEGVKNAWTLARDIANIGFIFILLYIAIKTVLGESNSQKLITQVIIAALLVNFSAVIPRTIIDISNIFAITFYENLGPQIAGSQARDITTTFLAASSPAYGIKMYADAFVNTFSPSHSLSVESYIPGTLMFILAYILLVGGILFVLRIVVLVLILVSSPLAVIGWIIPSTASYSKQWLSKLINEAIFAPIFMFLIYISIIILRDSSLSNLDPSGSSTSKIISFIIVCSLLLVSLYVAKKFSGDGASYAMGWGKGAKGWFMGATVGTAGAYGLGKLANKAATSDTIKNLSAKSPLLGGFVRERLDKVADYKFAGGASYKDRVSKSADRITGFKTKELRAQYLASLSETDKAAAYGKLSEREKAELHDHVDTLAASATPTRQEQAIIDAVNGNTARGKKGLAPKTGSEAWDKLEDEKERYRASQSAREAREELEDVGTALPPTPAQIKDAVRKLKGNAINRVELDKLLDPTVAKHLDGPQLRKIAESSNFSSSQMMVSTGGGPITLRNYLMDEMNRAAGLPPGAPIPPTHIHLLPDNLKSALKYLTSTHGNTYYV
ncbi:MAG: hypothetical protein KBC48_01585 [Candidatus Pacebacteria bacterium]|nr:hypothetical protein [Candidatus Paceibacterota bacterium]